MLLDSQIWHKKMRVVWREILFTQIQSYRSDKTQDKGVTLLIFISDIFPDISLF